MRWRIGKFIIYIIINLTKCYETIHNNVYIYYYYIERLHNLCKVAEVQEVNFYYIIFIIYLYIVILNDIVSGN